MAQVKKTILFVAIDSHGHINSLISAANYFRRRGHRTIFLFQDPIDSGLADAGHEVYDCATEDLVPSDREAARNSKKYDKVFVQMDEILKNPTIENECQWFRSTGAFMLALIKQKEPTFEKKIKLINPDLLIVDQFRVQPAILECGKPWALIYSPSPLRLHPAKNNLPPAFLGIPTNYKQIEDNSLREYYEKCAKMYNEFKDEHMSAWNDYLIEVLGYNPNPDSEIQISPYLSLYMYPKELDYEPKLEHWIQCDSILRNNSDIDNIDSAQIETDNVNDKKLFEIPIELRDKPGKLIFLSMGTLACANVGIMKRLVAICSKSPHRFIVSCGPNWKEYELADNMWGQAHVDQLAILPIIDLIITHGGNNTITECFYYGVPGFIVCPVFGDQKDNAQRIEECKLGRKLAIFQTSEEQFLQAIEDILADATIKPRMAAISKRMQTPDSKFKALRLLRDFVEK